MSVDWNDMYWWQGVLLMLVTAIVELGVCGLLALLWEQAEKRED